MNAITFNNQVIHLVNLRNTKDDAANALRDCGECEAAAERAREEYSKAVDAYLDARDAASLAVFRAAEATE